MQNSRKTRAVSSPAPKKQAAVKTPRARKSVTASARTTAGASKPSRAEPELKAPQAKPAGAKNLPQKPIAALAEKSGKSDAKKAKNKKAGAKAQAKADPAKASKEKPKKAKLVRDSFTMPENEYQMIADIKKACLKAGFAIKKSEVLRIGVALLQKMPASNIQAALSALPALKAGRPKKEERAASAQ